MLICRESLLCGGKAAEEEPRGCHLMCLWYIKNWWKMLKAALSPLCLHMPRFRTLQESVTWVLARAWFEMAHRHLCPLEKRAFPWKCVRMLVGACVRTGTCTWLHSFPPLYSPVTEMFVHCGHHWENAESGRYRAEDPCNLTRRMSENVTQSQELSSGSAGATQIM